MTKLSRAIVLLSLCVFYGTSLPGLAEVGAVTNAPTPPGYQAAISNTPSDAVQPAPKKRGLLGWFTRDRTPEGLAQAEEQKRQRQAELDHRESELERRSGQLQVREKDLLARREQRPLFHLRDLVNAIDRDNGEAKRDLDKLYRGMDDLRGELAKSKAQLAGKQARREKDGESDAERSETIENLNEDIVLQRLKADQMESLIDLRAEATRLDRVIDSMALSPRPTVHLLVEKRRAIADGERKRVESRLAMDRARQVHDEIAQALELLLSKQGELVQYVQLKERKYDLTHDRAIREDMDVGKVRLRLVEKRIETLRAQVASMEAGLAVCGRLHELHDAELAVLRMDFEELLRSYA